MNTVNESWFACPVCNYENCIEIDHNVTVNKICQNTECKACLEIKTTSEVRAINDGLIERLRREASEMEKALASLKEEK